MKLIISRSVVNSVIRNVGSLATTIHQTVQSSKVPQIRKSVQINPNLGKIPSFENISTTPVKLGKVIQAYRNNDSIIFELNDDVVLWSLNRSIETIEKLSQPCINAIDNLYHLGKLYDGLTNKVVKDFKQEFEIPEEKIQNIDLEVKISDTKPNEKSIHGWTLQIENPNKIVKLAFELENGNLIELKDLIAKSGNIQTTVYDHNQHMVLTKYNQGTHLSDITHITSLPKSLIIAILKYHKIAKKDVNKNTVT